jgi:small subunit ribosomal protein S17
VSESTRGRRKSLVGTVVSVKMDKTAVVAVERRYPHRLYHKIVRSTKRYKAHDAANAAVLGDTVRIVETRPISKEKRWRIAETLVRGNVAEIAPREIGMPEESHYRPERSEPAPAAVAEAAPVAAAPTESAADLEEAPVAAVEEVPVAADEAPTEEAPVAEVEEVVAAEGEEATSTDAAKAPAEEEAEGAEKK